MKPVLTEITTNPCKMCMPMGAVTAMMGLADCSVLLHGSQGCSTYIRRHMATHYNEPVDIASSSLTEEGTVYGGEKNLMTGLDNLVKVYNPKIIGLATTCLAETIGEDIEGMARKYAESRSTDVRLVPVSTPGYCGTQYEGYFRALTAIVRHLAGSRPGRRPTDGRKLLNLVTGPVSPADSRWLKAVTAELGYETILLPDISETLDAGLGTGSVLKHQGGTTLADIESMGQSDLTIELATFLPDDASPGRWLEENFQVPLRRLNMPVGLRDTDAFLEALGSVNHHAERSRYLDAMVDSHKTNARGRAVISGEPDFAYAVARLCSELGIRPVVIATGSRQPAWRETCQQEFAEFGAVVMDDADFAEIENKAAECKANLIIGSSDARRIEEKTGLPLIRCAFPVHDRIGGQRIRLLGYEGSLLLADQMTNTLLAAREDGFRDEIRETYFKPAEKPAPTQAPAPAKTRSAAEKTKSHPCFTQGAACHQGRIHLPVAPACNIQCNYCVRSFDCPNESRPGVTTKVLKPTGAAERYRQAKEKLGNLSVVGIAGPGDALANIEQTAETLQRVLAIDPDVTFCLSTNGLMLPFYADRLLALGVSHLTITINAIDPEIGAKIYKHVNYFGRRLEGVEAARVLIQNQLGGLAYLAGKGMEIKVNTVLIKGVNDDHVETVVRTVRDLGATISNIMQLIPVKGSAFEDMPLVSAKELNQVRKLCGEHLKQMYHCQQCRADAVGLLGQDVSAGFAEPAPCHTEKPDSAAARSAPEEKPAASEPTDAARVAVFSQSGWLVDQHFGQAREASIYEMRDGVPVLLEKRSLDQYCKGEDDCGDHDTRMNKVVEALRDCQTVMALRIGDSPREKLQNRGIEVVTTYEPILEALLRQTTRK